MPVFHTSYPDKKTTEAIDSLVGKPFGLLENLRMGGTGCQRMLVKQASENLHPYINDLLYPSYVGLELRPRGILVSLSHVLKRHTWPIPYAQLMVTENWANQGARKATTLKPLQSLVLTLADGEHTLVLIDHRGTNAKFVQKLLRLQRDYTTT